MILTLPDRYKLATENGGHQAGLISLEELILANNDGATLTLSQKHRAPVSNVTASASDGLPSAGAATGLLDSSPPLSTNEELRY